MKYTCCLCGKVYESESAVVKCVNRCGRAMHKSGIFETKAANYSQGKIEIAYGQDFDTKGLKDKCIEKLNCARATISNGVFLRLNGMIKNWDNMDKNERKQLFDMIIMYCGD